jgi:hypothetical protein
MADPSRAKERMDMELPKRTKSSMLTEDPSFEMPKMESALPKRTKLRRLNALPRAT